MLDCKTGDPFCFYAPDSATVDACGCISSCGALICAGILPPDIISQSSGETSGETTPPSLECGRCLMLDCNTGDRYCFYSPDSATVDACGCITSCGHMMCEEILYTNSNTGYTSSIPIFELYSVKTKSTSANITREVPSRFGNMIRVQPMSVVKLSWVLVCALDFQYDFENSPLLIPFAEKSNNSIRHIHRSTPWR